jgi:hypothetical protein
MENSSTAFIIDSDPSSTDRALIEDLVAEHLEYETVNYISQEVRALLRSWTVAESKLQMPGRSGSLGCTSEPPPRRFRRMARKDHRG